MAKDLPRSSLPLRGVVVADFSRILAGPLCSQLLGDAGARVVKVEERGRGDETRRWGPPFAGGESAYFLSLNRNKESIALDLKSGAGREVAARLIAKADVVLHNFRPDQQKAFGLDVKSVRRLNRRAVHCTITGFDSDGDRAGLPGYDLLAQAAAGLMAITGAPDGGPTKIGVALSDVLTAHFACNAITAALFARERGDAPKAIEISLFGATVASLVNVAQNYLVTGEEPKRYGNAHPSIVPYQTFDASDRTFALAVATDRHFHLLCSTVLKMPELASDARYATNVARVKNRDRLIPILAEELQKKKAAVWVSRCTALGIPAALVQRFEEILDASVVGTIEHESLGALPLVRNPLRLDGARLPLRSAPPLLGRHTKKILRELGYSAKEIAKLAHDAVI